MSTFQRTGNDIEHDIDHELEQDIGNDRGRDATHSVVALALVLAAMLAVAWGARGAVTAVVYSTQVAEFDGAARMWMRGRATGWSDAVWMAISWAGSPVAMAVLAIGGGAWHARRRVMARGASTRGALERRTLTRLAVWLVAFGGSSALAVSLKQLFARARPPGALEFLHAASYSFPSTHTLTSLVGFGMLGVAFGAANRAPLPQQRGVVARSWQRALLGIAFLFVATSRVALGVHYVSDVAASALVGACWLAACAWAYARV